MSLPALVPLYPVSSCLSVDVIVVCLSAAFLCSCRVLTKRRLRPRGHVAPLAMMAASEQEKTCKFCNFKYLPEKGRQHGRVFHCTTCSSADRVLRHNLGSRGSSLDSFSGEESCKFFRDVHRKKEESPNKKLKWTSLRAMLVSALTQRRISSFKTKLTGKELPLEVWVTKGWPRETVLASPNVWSDKHQCQLYVVDVKETSWSEEYQHVESEVLKHEADATAARQSKKTKKSRTGAMDAHSSDDEMALPSAPQEGKEEKKQEQSLKKVLQQNASVANRAAKAMGPISQNWTSLANLQEKVAKAGVPVEPGIAESARQAAEKFRSWSEAARSAVNMHESSKQLAQDDVQRLADLPFVAADLKTAVQQSTEICKCLRSLLPVKAAKGKAKPKACPKKAAAAVPENAAVEARDVGLNAAEEESKKENQEPVQKRRRTKSAS